MGLAELLFGICRNGSRLEMYDVNFGGTKHMTKRLNIALVAVALLLVLVVVVPVSATNYAVARNIGMGATVFIGEQGLNLTRAQQQATGANSFQNTTFPSIGWWGPGAVVNTTSPTLTIPLAGMNAPNNGSFTITAAQFGQGIGNWYAINPDNGYVVTPAFFTVADPTLSIYVWDLALDSDMSGKSVVQGRNLGFKVATNMYTAISSPGKRDPVSGTNPTYQTTAEGWSGSDGYIDIKVKDTTGSTLTNLVNGSYNLVGGVNAVYANPITRVNVSVQPWIWGAASATGAYNPSAAVAADSAKYSNWSTAATDRNGQYVYPPGTYTITAESYLNNMKDNYGADVTGKSVSAAVTVTLVSDSIKIEANKDSVVRSKPFSVTITGKPSTSYHMWVKGTSSMTGGYDSQPPMIQQYQAGVAQDPFTADPKNNPEVWMNQAPGVAGNYSYQNGGGGLANNIWSNVATGGTDDTNKAKLGNGTYLYANITTLTTGVRTVQWETTNWTKAQTYTIRVEQQFVNGVPNTGTTTAGSTFTYNAGTYFSDEVNVKVEKGAVTIVAAGDQSYYLGEEIKFSGTNTESYNTYLFITGPNLKSGGSQIQSTNPRADAVTDTDASTFQSVSVLGDNTWSWKWGTSTVALDAGTYTIYAVSQPRNSADQHLSNTAFGTVSIIIKKPFVSATASQSTVAQGDRVYITGTAEGQPTLGVKIWVLGKNYPTQPTDVKTQSVNADASFKYEITQSTTKNLYPGQYFVVVQHPMQNNIFDIYESTTSPSGAALVAGSAVVLNRQNLAGTTNLPSQVFTLLGASSLQGSDAAEALVQGINSANVDDTYTKLQFLVEVPVIRIDPIGDKHVGDKFTITASTNLAVDDEVLVQVYSSSFKPTQKSQSGEFSGATGTVKVKKGDSGMNKITFDVDSSTFKPDEYIVTADAILQVATGTALFNVLEGAAPVVTTKAPVVTTVAPVVTTVAPVVTTVPPTPTPTKSPGYGALIALIGLGAVAFIVVRRH